jgi:DNA gyrase subunit A
MGRAAQGVKLINLKGKSAIAAVARVPRSEDDEDVVTVDEDGNVIETPPTESTEGTEGTENGTDIENNDAVE